MQQNGAGVWFGAGRGMERAQGVEPGHVAGLGGDWEAGEAVFSMIKCAVAMASVLWGQEHEHAGVCMCQGHHHLLSAARRITRVGRLVVRHAMDDPGRLSPGDVQGARLRL